MQNIVIVKCWKSRVYKIVVNKKTFEAVLSSGPFASSLKMH